MCLFIELIWKLNKSFIFPQFYSGKEMINMLMAYIIP